MIVKNDKKKIICSKIQAIISSCWSDFSSVFCQLPTQTVQPRFDSYRIHHPWGSQLEYRESWSTHKLAEFCGRVCPHPSVECAQDIWFSFCGLQVPGWTLALLRSLCILLLWWHWDTCCWSHLLFFWQPLWSPRIRRHGWKWSKLPYCTFSAS